MRETYREYFARPLSIEEDVSAYDQRVCTDDVAKDSEYFYELYQDCFQHHVQPNLQTQGISLAAIVDESKKRLVQQDSLAAYFIRQLYKPAAIYFTSSTDQIDQRRHPRDFDELFNDVTGSAVDREFQNTNLAGTNRINFLIGDVGVGKSLLTTKIIAEINWRQEQFAPLHVVPVYIDFETVMRASEGGFRDVDMTFVDDLLSAVTLAVTKRGWWKSEYASLVTGNADARGSFVRLNRRLIQDGMRLFLALDNTDKYHFHYSKYAFFDPYRNTQYQRVAQNFNRLFDILAKPEYLGDQGLSVLFVSRRSTLKSYLTAPFPEDNRNSVIQDYGIYQLGKVDESVAIESRFELMHHAVKVIEAQQPAKGAIYREQMDILLRVLLDSLKANSPHSLSAIVRITHHGVRSFIDFLRLLRPDFRHQYDLVDRLFNKPHNLVRLYITNVYKKYSQSQNHFPNLFLVDAMVAPSNEFPLAHKPHRHTYWLKYLILKFIVSRHENHQVTTFQELKERFVDRCGYAEHLFCLTLGSLNAVNMSWCIEVDETLSPSTGLIRIRPTSRGKFLVGSDSGQEFAFDFDYLQFVVDDMQMSYPAEWLGRIYKRADLGYVTSPAPVFNAGLFRYLHEKGDAVLNLLYVLEASANYEVEAFLKHDSKIRALLPDVAQMRQGFMQTYRLICTHVSRGNELVATLENSANKVDKESIEEFFNGYQAKSDLFVEGP